MPMFWSQQWFRLWLGAVKQQAITWTIVDQDPCCHTASLGSNGLSYFALVIIPFSIWCRLDSVTFIFKQWENKYSCNSRIICQLCLIDHKLHECSLTQRTENVFVWLVTLDGIMSGFSTWLMNHVGNLKCINFQVSFFEHNKKLKLTFVIISWKLYEIAAINKDCVPSVLPTQLMYSA